MAIPEHVKKQAIDAISYKETTAQIWLARNNAPPGASPIFTPKAEQPVTAANRTASPADKSAQPTTRGISPEVGKQAKDALASVKGPAQKDLFQSPDVRAHIQLVKDNGYISPMATPSKTGHAMAQKIGQMQKTQSVDAVHRAATKDGFGR